MSVARFQSSRRLVRKAVKPRTYISADQPNGAPADPLTRKTLGTICSSDEFVTHSKSVEGTSEMEKSSNSLAVSVIRNKTKKANDGAPWITPAVSHGERIVRQPLSSATSYTWRGLHVLGRHSLAALYRPSMRRAIHNEAHGRRLQEASDLYFFPSTRLRLGRGQW
jgi:hypothetical protein